MERDLEAEFEAHFNADLATVTDTPIEIAAKLRELNATTGTNAAVFWAIPNPDFLHLVLVTPDGETLVLDRYDLPRDKLDNLVRRFHRSIQRVQDIESTIASGQELYQWILEPFDEEYLAAKGIDKILFCLGDGLRGLPISALHDGEQFLLEKYSMTLIPAFNLIETDYQRDPNRYVLAMGTEDFTDQTPLPAVPVELANIVASIQQFARETRANWQAIELRDRDFTLATLEQYLQRQSFDIVHLATHAAFVPGEPSESYIQFRSERLSLAQMREIRWSQPPIDLLVLSACETVLGDAQAELGFAGVALHSGVRSVIASRWLISDAGTLALMVEFYRQLPTAPTKAEALRQAQLELLHGKVKFERDQLRLPSGEISLPDSLQGFTPEDLSHPFFWASFTMVSHPW
jgi:CHAT domain-containing protein